MTGANSSSGGGGILMANDDKRSIKGDRNSKLTMKQQSNSGTGSL